MRKLKKLDDTLKRMDFDAYFEITQVGINVTGNPNDKFTQNNRIVEFGFKDQTTRLIKTKDSLSMVSFGLQLTTFYSILHVYRFFATYLKSVKAYTTNFFIQTSPDLYVKFIKDVGSVKRMYDGYSRDERMAANWCENINEAIIDQRSAKKQN